MATTTLKVNSVVWDHLAQDQQNQINRIIALAHLVPDDVVIQSDPTLAVPPFPSLCKIACDAAESGAVAACDAITDGAGFAACVAAAHAGGDYCRSQC